MHGGAHPAISGRVAFSHTELPATRGALEASMDTRFLARWFVTISTVTVLNTVPGPAGFGTPPPPLGTAVVAAQIDAGILADIRDREVTATYQPTLDETDLSLALVPAAPDGRGEVTLVLTARYRGRTTDFADLSDIIIRAHYSVLSDEGKRSARAHRNETHALHLFLDPHDPTGITLFFFPVSAGYGGYWTPGAEAPVAYFRATPADVRALTVVEAVTGSVLWSDFVLDAAQVEALRAFARRVAPVS
jgi:hypothetical protein